MFTHAYVHTTFTHTYVHTSKKLSTLASPVMIHQSILSRSPLALPLVALPNLGLRSKELTKACCLSVSVAQGSSWNWHVWVAWILSEHCEKVRVVLTSGFRASFLILARVLLFPSPQTTAWVLLPILGWSLQTQQQNLSWRCCSRVKFAWSSSLQKTYSFPSKHIYPKGGAPLVFSKVIQNVSSA